MAIFSLGASTTTTTCPCDQVTYRSVQFARQLCQLQQMIMEQNLYNDQELDDLCDGFQFWRQNNKDVDKI